MKTKYPTDKNKLLFYDTFIFKVPLRYTELHFIKRQSLSMLYVTDFFSFSLETPQSDLENITFA